MRPRIVVMICLIPLFTGCGDETSPEVDGVIVGAPLNLRALSVDDNTIRIIWDQPGGANTETVRGYGVRWDNRRDTLPFPSSEYSASVRPPRVVTFSVVTLLTTGEASDSVTIAWAPAARYDSAFVLIEFYNAQPGRVCGLDAGTTTRAPSAMALTPAAEPLLDMYLIGNGGQPLLLQSARLYSQDWNATLFSTVSHPSGNLDYPLPAFPGTTTFTQESITLQQNTIYYARIVGEGGDYHFVRLHVRTSGTYPNRSCEVRLSLQRLPNTPYACVDRSRKGPRPV
jgi:hypothetical protein